MTSLKICTAETMLSDSAGLDFAEGWLPRIVAERFATSGRDGSVDRAPDPVAFIDTDLLWTNETGTAQHCHVSVHRASRNLLTSMFNRLVLDDAYSVDVGPAPSAPTPTGAVNGIGFRFTNARSFEQLRFRGWGFMDLPDYQSYYEIGEPVDPGDSVHFRYRCLFSTPGNWRTPPSPRYEANARWARLRLFAAPYVSGSV